MHSVEPGSQTCGRRGHFMRPTMLFGYFELIDI